MPFKNVADKKAYQQRYAQENRKELTDSNTRYRRKMRRKAIAGYGGKCACCGESAFEFLAIDHVNNDGAEDRRNRIDSTEIARRIVQEGFPPKYRILCHNCNCARGFYGYCPHEKENGEIQMSFQAEVQPEDESLPEAGNGMSGSGSVSVLGYNIPVSYSEGSSPSHSSPISRPAVTDL